MKKQKTKSRKKKKELSSFTKKAIYSGPLVSMFLSCLASMLFAIEDLKEQWHRSYPYLFGDAVREKENAFMKVLSSIKKCLPPLNNTEANLPITGESIVNPINFGGFLSGEVDTHFIPQAISFLLILAEISAVGVFLYNGALFVAAGGDDQHYTNAKNGMIYSVIGITVIAAAYAVITGLLKLKLI